MINWIISQNEMDAINMDHIISMEIEFKSSLKIDDQTMDAYAIVAYDDSNDTTCLGFYTKAEAIQNLRHLLAKDMDTEYMMYTMPKSGVKEFNDEEVI